MGFAKPIQNPGLLAQFSRRANCPLLYPCIKAQSNRQPTVAQWVAGCFLLFSGKAERLHTAPGLSGGILDCFAHLRKITA
jgi:hypothetical protein